MSDPFVAAVNYLIDRIEGGQKLVDDQGGLTRFGISKRGNPDIDIEQLTREDAVRLYHERYWTPARCDRLPPALALQFFVAYVNMKPAGAIKALQTALVEAGTLVRVDGVLGPQTLGAAREYKPQAELRACFSRACIDHYVSLAEDWPKHRPSLHGWIGRVCRVADEAGAWGTRE